MNESTRIDEVLTNRRGEVRRFRDDYAFLSNFAKCQIRDFEGNVFTSAEAMFQSYKTTDPKERAKFAKMSPKQAKAAGRKIKLREDWEEIKFDVMWYTVYQKFHQNSILERKLFDTAGMDLIEGNTWGDKYWGAVPTKVPMSDGDVITLVGENRLGQILEQVRMVLLDCAAPQMVEIKEKNTPIEGRWYGGCCNVSAGPSIAHIADGHTFDQYYMMKMHVIEAIIKRANRDEK